MAIEVRDAIAAVNTYNRRDVEYRVVARPMAQIVTKEGNVIVESQNEWEVRELYRLIKGRVAP